MTCPSLHWIYLLLAPVQTPKVRLAQEWFAFQQQEGRLHSKYKYYHMEEGVT